MNNPFQEQLLKAGVVTKQQVQKANQEKHKKNKQHRKSKQPVINKAAEKARLAAKQKAERDRELNLKRQEQAKNKAISIEIDQLIQQNSIKRDKDCEIGYNFEHKGKIKRIYVNGDLKGKITQGQLGIARIEGRYEVVPLAIAKKIQQRNDKRVIILEKEEKNLDSDSYSDYEIPDDLMW